MIGKNQFLHIISKKALQYLYTDNEKTQVHFEIDMENKHAYDSLPPFSCSRLGISV